VKALATPARLERAGRKNGNTPLHAAVSTTTIVLIHYLSRGTCAPIATTRTSPLDLAQSRGRGSAKLFER